jgi:hypothetical protein
LDWKGILAVQRIIPESRATVTVCARTDSHRRGPEVFLGELADAESRVPSDLLEAGFGTARRVGFADNSVLDALGASWPVPASNDLRVAALDRQSHINFHQADFEGFVGADGFSQEGSIFELRGSKVELGTHVWRRDSLRT